MSENLNTPWIAEYLINVAETYGCELSDVPLHVKPGKKFTEDDCIWAYVSDKHQQIPVRFSRHAIAQYSKINQSDSQGKRLTQQHCAIATIKSFKPMFQRVPSGRVGKMTIEPTLALNVDHVQIVGAAGEPEFGSPRTLETHSDLNEWMEGLRAGDGSGNVLKLRKAKRVAQEQGEASVIEAAYKENSTTLGHQMESTRPEEGAVQSDRQVHAEQDDWRQSIEKKPLFFYKRPKPNDSTASKPLVTGTKKENNNHNVPLKRLADLRRGPLDLDSSPIITHDIDDDSPARLQRQTTPSEWLLSPEQSHEQPSPSPEPVEEWPLSPPSTPPLFTQEQPEEVPTLFSQTARSSHDIDLTSLRAPTPAQRHPSLPLPPSNSSTHHAMNSRNKATSLPSDVFRSGVSNMRRVPPPSAKNVKEACGEVLVPDSESEDLGSPSSFHKNSSPGWPRTESMVAPGHELASLRASFSPKRANDMYYEKSSTLDLKPSQDINSMQLDWISRMALNGSYLEHTNGDDARTRNKVTGYKEEAEVFLVPSRSPEPSWGQLPPSSLPIRSPSPTCHHSTAFVEETVAVEGGSVHATPSNLLMTATKRAKHSFPLQDSPLRSKRPRLRSREPTGPSHQTSLEEDFDPELLKLGIKVNLADYDKNPPPYPWGEDFSRLNLKPLEHPLLITNATLAEIWKGVCKSRGWYVD
ncbi:hypothetical protein B0F90DRAFT_1820266 [Multifurca ochricompacta]|uniref:Telomere replication protein EST3 n=1 Tax=Multifurca ochricompacta TaxID=376703 RepID=A0AAD4M162_9AGAM|nr:hypothetical protein B0F90DRAFT_1820266 [Multifurca ochricompacta]